MTGASKGIGAAIARALAADGWHVAVNYRSDEAGANATVKAIEDAGGKAVALHADVTNGAPDELFTQAEEQLGGPVLALVNNAGVAADGLAIQLDDDAWDRVIDTNLTAAFRLTRRAMRPMIKARYGRIINVASVVGPRANAGQSNYAAAKAGLIGMTKTVAAEVARRGVTVNAVAPGFIETDMTKDVPEAVVEAIPARR
ncbi:MAG TPA: SDR family NAD(P)-dependent oxidoreductase, partial [Solirubrobacteraceae bacterium]|nr:SDR family NAD(P)-dependent oxidoreductase [Solirubrobacteraceae bacterium]